LILVVVAQRQDAVGDVARLVAHDVGGQVAQERIRRVHADHPEGRQRQPLDHDLHAEELHVPPAVLQDHVEQGLQVRVDRVGEPDLLVQVAVVDIDVAGLVDDLGRAVELGVEILDRVDELGGGQERALLAVEELRQGPRRGLEVDRGALALAQAVPDRRAKKRHQLLGAHRRLEVRRQMPRQDHVALPLRARRLDVEIAQLVAAVLVAPGVRDVQDRLEGLDRRGRHGVGASWGSRRGSRRGGESAGGGDGRGDGDHGSLQR
jgi:hypothetical protein